MNGKGFTVNLAARQRAQLVANRLQMLADEKANMVSHEVWEAYQEAADLAASLVEG